MITTILSDFSRVILFPKDKNYKGTLNGLYKELENKKIPYDFFDYFEFNDDILNLYRQLKNKYSINIFTTGTIQNTQEVKQKLDNIFDNIFSAEEYGLDKAKPDSYKFIANKLGKQASQILYIDDQEKNIKAAKKTGMETILYTNYQTFVLNGTKYKYKKMRVR
jgi:HAD superfamily hydrolase (TIGR01509 family)